MKISKTILSILAALIFIGGSAFAACGKDCDKACCKKEGSAQKEDKDKKCEKENKEGSSGEKKAEEKPAENK